MNDKQRPLADLQQPTRMLRLQPTFRTFTAALADRIGGYKGGFHRNMDVAGWITDIGFPLTLNAVVHRENLDDLPATIDMALRFKARRIEIACVQFQGWALVTRAKGRCLRCRDPVIDPNGKLIYRTLHL